MPLSSFKKLLTNQLYSLYEQKIKSLQIAPNNNPDECVLRSTPELLQSSFDKFIKTSIRSQSVQYMISRKDQCSSANKFLCDSKRYSNRLSFQYLSLLNYLLVLFFLLLLFGFWYVIFDCLSIQITQKSIGLSLVLAFDRRFLAYFFFLVCVCLIFLRVFKCI